MGMLIRYGLIALPIIELVALIVIGDAIGALPTLGLLLLSAVVGVLVLRVLGRATLGDLAEAFRRGESPVADVARGLCVVLAGILLILPGPVTDLLALALLARPLQHRLARLIFGRPPVPPAAPGASASGMGPVIIDVPVEEVQPTPHRPGTLDGPSAGPAATGPDHRPPDGRRNPWGDPKP
ncbi:MAG: FxsA family protein [Alphaproteobacteria bacterium]|nr:FxsA family protein [Alphaproteobacteria bacterium]TAD90467.1 MAG: FxsA family protein [Alphaproteobacteria bacterium]